MIMEIVMSKIEISSETWVDLYCELSTYVESKCFPHRKTHNDQGERLVETEDDFLEIVDDVENLMSEFFIKGDL
tara:strand:+ start:2746 stop:2967 length:222 start_codon:yes stop_codon:yes gene_type:complete